jgi:glycosyltransferase involved in cell wall biosynthesis
MSPGPARAAERLQPRLGLEIEPPGRIAVGGGNAVVIGGYCYVPDQKTRGLAIGVGGSRQRVQRFRLPRGDVYQQLDARGTVGAHAYRSGFVAVVDLEPVERPERLEIELVLTLEDGHDAIASAGWMIAEPRLGLPADYSPPPSPDSGAPLVAICMATYEPPGDLLRTQLESIREQTHENWVCLISDDCSSDMSFERLRELTDRDPRFAVSRSPERLGFYRNFERALSMAPAEADYVTLCDQDDRWRPGKLERLLKAIGDAQLAYSDARIVSPEGDVVKPSYWTERSNNYKNFGSLLLANSVTGAASLFRRELLDDALPFPPRLAGAAFHDHWLAMVARARGEIAYVDEPLWDYVQHDRTVIGHSRANKRPRSIRRHLIERLLNPTGGSRAVYYYDWQQQILFGEVLRMRCWDRMTAQKRRTLRRLLSADRGVAGLGWLLGRRARRLWGRDETLDRELFYSYALLRRRAVSLWTAGRRRPNRLLPRDESIPTDSDRAA